MTRKKLIFWSLAAFGVYYYMKHRAATASPSPAALPAPGSSSATVQPVPGLTLVSNTGGATGSW